MWRMPFAANGSCASTAGRPAACSTPCRRSSARRTAGSGSHANYAHHQAALLRVLGLPVGSPADVDRATARIARWAGADLEEALAAEGGVGAVVRTRQEWEDHAAGRAALSQPIVDLQPGGSVAPGPPPMRPSARRRGTRSRTALPAWGFRVLDLTRVIAGPVATRTLAALGAQVLRIDPPHLAEIPVGHLDTGPGKHTALVDLRDPAGRATLHRLLAEADVLVHGYRPGALAGLGLAPDEIAREHPAVVTVGLSAWGWAGPWAGRRGFDSIVQAASGLADACGTPDTPGVLPAQVLDHATGHLVAAAALRGLTLRTTTGHCGHARLSLAATAAHLLAAERSAGQADPLEGRAPADEPLSAFGVELDTGYGRASQVRPPGALDGVPLAWPFGAHRWGSDEARWADPDE